MLSQPNRIRMRSRGPPLLPPQSYGPLSECTKRSAALLLFCLLSVCGVRCRLERRVVLLFGRCRPSSQCMALLFRLRRR